MNFTTNIFNVFEDGKMLQNVLFAACDIFDNPNKVDNFRPFGVCKTMHPVLFTDTIQMHNFIELLCESTHKGRCGQIRYNINTCKNVILYTKNDFKVTLTERTERQKELFTPLYVYGNLEKYSEFALLCKNISTTIVNQNAKIVILEDCAKFLVRDNYWTIKNELEKIAHNLDCCIFAGFCMEKIEEMHTHNMVYLENEKIENSNVLKYIYNNGTCVGITLTGENKSRIKVYNEQYLLKKLLPKIANEPIFSKNLEYFFCGVYKGDKTINTIYQMLSRARVQKILVQAHGKKNRNKYILNTGENTQVTQEKKEVAITALSDAQETGKRARIPILYFGDIREIIDTALDEDAPNTIQIFMHAIIKGEYLNFRANKERKKILYISVGVNECDQISIQNLENFTRINFDKLDLIKITECINNNLPDYVFINMGTYRGNELEKVPFCDLEFLQTNTQKNAAIIVNYNLDCMQYFSFRENNIFYTNLTCYEYIRKLAAQKWSNLWTSFAPAGNGIFVIRGIQKGIAFKNIVQWNFEKEIYEKPKPTKAIDAFLFETFCECKKTLASQILDCVTGHPVTKNTLKIARERGYIYTEKKQAVKNKKRITEYYVTFMK